MLAEDSQLEQATKSQVTVRAPPRSDVPQMQLCSLNTLPSSDRCWRTKLVYTGVTLISTDSTLFSLLSYSQAEQQQNAQKGTGITTLLQEGTELFLGANAGKVVGTAGKAVGALATLPGQSHGRSNSDVDFDQPDEYDDQVENPVVAERPVSPSTASQVDHL